MNIDFTILFKILLPTFMRNGLKIFINILSLQFTNLYNDFKSWQTETRLQASMTCQVMYIEMMLNYKLLNSFVRTIYISDGDGVIVDFVVNIPDAVVVDNYRLIALLDKYKIAGKRYSIVQSNLTYQITWINKLCEVATPFIGMDICGGKIAAINGTTVYIVYYLANQNWANAKVIAEGLDNGWGDWRLPTQPELELMVINRDTIGYDYGDLLWSSDEVDANSALAVSFPQNGNTFTTLKSTTQKAWAVRTITNFSNDQYERATKLQITVFQGGVEQSVAEFPLTESFVYNSVNYSAITTEVLMSITNDEYNIRVMAYAAYVQANYQSQYPGLTVTGDDSRTINTNLCQIP